MLSTISPVVIFCRCICWLVHNRCAQCPGQILIRLCLEQKAGATAADESADDEDAEDAAAQGANFDYLLDMALKTLTEEKVPHLLACNPLD
jgi:hypothetical protein